MKRNLILTSVVLFSAACGSSHEDEGATQAGIFFPPVQLVPPGLTIGRITPDTPIEGRPMAIEFDISGYVGTRSGWVGAMILPPNAPPYESGDYWQVSGLARGEIMHGVVFAAPPKANVGTYVKLFYFEQFTQSGEFQHAGPHVSESGPLTFDIGARFRFAVTRLQVERTINVNTSDYVNVLAKDVSLTGSWSTGGQHEVDHGSDVTIAGISGNFDVLRTTPSVTLGYVVTNLKDPCGYVVGASRDITISGSALLQGSDASGAVTYTLRDQLATPWYCNASDYTVTSQFQRVYDPSDAPAISPRTVRVRQGGSVTLQAIGFSGPTWQVEGGGLNGILTFAGNGQAVFTATQPLSRDQLVVVSASDSRHTARAFISLQ